MAGPNATHEVSHASRFAVPIRPFGLNQHRDGPVGPGAYSDLGDYPMSRVIRRPANGWDRRPNHLLPDLLWFVLLGFGWACFFNWMSAALDVLATSLT